MDIVKILHNNVSVGSYEDFVSCIIDAAQKKESKYVCVANVHMLVESVRDPRFNAVLQDADMVTPDGVPLVWYARTVRKVRQPRVCGMDLLPDLLSKCEQESLSVFIYGGSKDYINAASNYLSEQYKGLKIAGLYSPPFKDLPLNEMNKVSDMINQSNANMVLVCLGCPKQEQWMYQMKGTILAPMIGIGGALPVLLGLNKRAPVWMQKSGLEWTYRLYQEPKRLFKRYFVTNSIFLFLFVKDIFLFRLLHFSSKTNTLENNNNIAVDIL
ncbi:MAG: WecB/TagA/CpsF family glycosyltransferase [Chitinophagaceae bacterium]